MIPKEHWKSSCHHSLIQYPQVKLDAYLSFEQVDAVYQPKKVADGKKHLLGISGDKTPGWVNDNHNSPMDS